jgi:hypothetical protein
MILPVREQEQEFTDVRLGGQADGGDVVAEERASEEAFRPS